MSSPHHLGPPLPPAPQRPRVGVRALLQLRPSPNRLGFGVRAALAIGICGFGGWAAGNIGAGLIATLGAFTALYGNGRPYRSRAGLLAAIAVGLVLCVLAGLAVATTSDRWLAVVLPAAVALLASFLCSAFDVGPPGAYILALACAVSTSMHGLAADPWRVALLVAAGGAVSWSVHMLPALRRPRAPEEQAVARGAQAVADYVASTAEGQPDRLRHATATTLHDTWVTLIVRQPARPRPDARLAGLRALTRELHRLFGRAITAASAGRAPDPSLAEAARAVAAQVTDPPPPPDDVRLPLGRISMRDRLAHALDWGSRPLTIALRVGVAAAIAGCVATLFGVTRPDWAIAGAVLVLYQGLDWLRAAQRALERTAGTLAGLLVAGAILWLQPRGLALVATLMLLQFAIELLILRNYALAVMVITPAALLIGTGSQAGVAAGPLLLGRGLDTVIGCGIGAAVLFATSRRHGEKLRDALAGTLEAAERTLPCLARGEVALPAAQAARRALRNHAFDLVRLYEEQAAGAKSAREEADRAWPAIVAAERLAFRILAACWEIESAGAAGRAPTAHAFTPPNVEPAVQALRALRSGEPAVIPASGSGFLRAELTALGETLPLWPAR